MLPLYCIAVIFPPQRSSNFVEYRSEWLLLKCECWLCGANYGSLPTAYGRTICDKEDSKLLHADQVNYTNCSSSRQCSLPREGGRLGETIIWKYGTLWTKQYLRNIIVNYKQTIIQSHSTKNLAVSRHLQVCNKLKNKQITIFTILLSLCKMKKRSNLWDTITPLKKNKALQVETK